MTSPAIGGTGYRHVHIYNDKTVPEILHILLGEVKVAQVLQHLIHPSKDDKFSTEGRLPEIEVEDGLVVVPSLLPIRIRHGDLQKGGPKCLSLAPAPQSMENRLQCCVYRPRTWYMSVSRGPTNAFIGRGTGEGTRVPLSADAILHAESLNTQSCVTRDQHPSAGGAPSHLRLP